VELPTVTTNPLAKGRGEKPKVRLLMKKTREVATNIYSRKTLEKTKKRYTDFENMGSGVVYARGRY